MARVRSSNLGLGTQEDKKLNWSSGQWRFILERKGKFCFWFELHGEIWYLKIPNALHTCSRQAVWVGD